MLEKNLLSPPLGYARVSTYRQTPDAQLEQLRAAGCTKIFHEKVTGARADLRELLRLLKALAPTGTPSSNDSLPSPGAGIVYPPMAGAIPAIPSSRLHGPT